MSIFAVIRKSDSTEVYRYSSDAPIEWDGMTFADFEHNLVEEPEPQPSPPPPVKPRLTKLQFIDRLGDAAYMAILAMAKDSLLVEAFIKRFEMTTPDPDGTSIDLADPRTVAGVTAVGAALVTQGAVSEDWADEVLNG